MSYRRPTGQSSEKHFPNCRRSFRVVLPKRTEAPQHPGCPTIRVGSLDL